MLRQVMLVAGLLFGSGMCALIYQMVWLREFRFVFWGLYLGLGRSAVRLFGGPWRGRVLVRAAR